jgi:putrescine transport system substrate-binding protein
MAGYSWKNRAAAWLLRTTLSTEWELLMSQTPRNVVALAALVALAACGKKPENVVNVYNWSDYVEPTVIEAFEKETGIKVRYEVMDSNEVLETKLQAGRTGYDVVVPSASFLARQIKAGIYQKLDRAQLTNWKNLDADITKRLEAFDPGNEHAVNYMWGTSGVGYNEAKINEAMPNAPVDSFRMFWDPEVAKNFEKCGISVLDAPSEIVGTVLMYLGKDANSENLDDLKAAEEVLMKVRPYVRLINSSKYIEDLANGEICLALGWSGDVLLAADRSEEAGKGFTIKYNIPKEGAVMFFDSMAIPADAGNVKNAHIFIDYMLRADVAAKNSNFLSYANSNAASWPAVDAEVKGNPNVFPPAELMAKLVPDMPESAEFTEALNRTWTRFRTGQ